MIDNFENDRATVLLIDDSPLIHKIVRRVLENQYEVITFTDGNEAVSKLNDIKPDLILLDVEMPEITGFDVIKLIKANPLIANVPVIFLTAKNDVEFELEALGLGAVDYINKPFANPLLMKRVEMHLSYAVRQRLLSNYNENLQAMVQEKTKIIKELQSAIISTLAELVEMRDTSTGGHIIRTKEYFRLFLNYILEHGLYDDKYTESDAQLMSEASQLHDIGKVAIPDAILTKPAKLTFEEFEIMKTHTTIGYEAIKKAMTLTSDKDFLNFAAIVTHTHHEKWNGAGYPCGLSGEEIPLPGRIMALVDVYDALVSVRHYKKAMTHEEAMKIIVEGRGQHFDPILVDAFVDINDRFEEVSKL